VKNAEPRSRRRGILENRFYRNISGASVGHPGVRRWKLYEHNSEAFDLIVVTPHPPASASTSSRRRQLRFLDHRLYKILMAPTRGVLKAVNVAAQAFLRTVSKVVGGEVVQDAVTFFQAFDGMEQGFKERAEHVLELLTHEQTSFILVTAPRRDVVDEATYFAQRKLRPTSP
jgi:hypothetical protein